MEQWDLVINAPKRRECSLIYALTEGATTVRLQGGGDVELPRSDAELEALKVRYQALEPCLAAWGRLAVLKADSFVVGLGWQEADAPFPVTYIG